MIEPATLKKICLFLRTNNEYQRQLREFKAKWARIALLNTNFTAREYEDELNALTGTAMHRWNWRSADAPKLRDVAYNELRADIKILIRKMLSDVPPPT